MALGLEEMILILVIAFVVIGPDELPTVARMAAKAYKKARTFKTEWTAEFTKEIDLETIKTEASKIDNEVSSLSKDVNSKKSTQEVSL